MRVYGYQSLAEAEEAKKEIINEINYILDRDLGLIDKQERTIGRWDSLIGKDSSYGDTKERLSHLENLLANTQLYISSFKTVIELE